MEITDHFNHYCVYNPQTNTYGEKYTWKQLLYFFYEGVKRGSGQVNWWHKDNGNPFSHYDIEAYFCKLGHTDNDFDLVEPNPSGYYKTHWKWVYDETKEKDIQVQYKVYVRYPYVKKFRLRIVDNFGRTISAGFLKAAYKEYIRKGVNDADKKPVAKKVIFTVNRYWVGFGDYVLKGYKFRNGPVPGIHHWRRRSRHPKADHGGTTGEIRRWYGDMVDQREVFEEYGTTFKLRGHRNGYELNPWNRKNHWETEKGWKRSKIEKQWMKGLRNLKP